MELQIHTSVMEKKKEPPPTTPPISKTSISNSKDTTENEKSYAASAEMAACYMANFINIIGSGKEVSMTKEYKPKVAFEFERYLNPETLKRQVFVSEKTRKTINDYAEENRIPKRKVESQVKNIINEIGLDRNLPIIRYCGMAITAIGKHITSGIYVNSNSINEVRSALGKNPVLYLPSHRSYMDFILMSYVCFYFDIEIPGIAAGMDFHSMFGMGTMLRKTGAFFMRRSFSDDELYWSIFQEYMHQLIVSYHIGVEFFIEGTRSRNFKALVPKIGLFSMALLPYFTGEVSDITIVPVSVSYERVLEEELFVYELLGVPKPKESTKGFLKALKIIDKRFGRMYMDFGKPISVRSFFHHTSADRMHRAAVGAHLQNLNKREIELVKTLANEVVYQQQRRIVITTFNLLSLYYASQLYAKKSVNIDELANGIKQLKLFFEELGAHVATNLNAIKPEIIETVEIHSNIVYFQNGQLKCREVEPKQLEQEIDVKRLKAHALVPRVMAIAVPTLALQLYINPCLFWLARPAFLILAALLELRANRLNNGNTKQKSYDKTMEILRTRSAILNDIFKQEFLIESNEEVEEYLNNVEFLRVHKILEINAQNGELIMHENECSRIILSAFAPFLCIYYQLTVTLNQLNAKNIMEFTKQEVLVHLQQRIEKLLLKTTPTRHVHPYCLALDNLQIALNYFIQEGYLVKKKNDSLQYNNTAKSLQDVEKFLLDCCELMPFNQYYEPASLTSIGQQQDIHLQSKL